MNPPHVVRILASVRIPSSHGPDVDYEIVHAMVTPSPDITVQREAVFLRLVIGSTPMDGRVAEILSQDLPIVHSHWTKFVEDVLWRRAQAGDADAQAALDRIRALVPAGPPPYPTPSPSSVPQISASGGRFGAKGAATEVPNIPVKKEKKPSEGPPVAPLIPGVSTGPRKYFGKVIDETPESAAPTPAAPKAPATHQVVAFNLTQPPTADTLIVPIEKQPHTLIVVAPFTIVRKVEEHIADWKAGKTSGQPTTFAPIVIRRLESGPTASKKLRAELAAGIARMLGTPNGVLWITPQP